MIIGRRTVIYEGLKSERYDIFIPIGAIKYRKDRRALVIPVVFSGPNATQAGWARKPHRRRDGAITMEIEIFDRYANDVIKMLKNDRYELSTHVFDLKTVEVGDDKLHLVSGRLRQITLIANGAHPKRKS